MNCEQTGIWIETVVSYLMVIFWNSTGDSERNTQKGFIRITSQRHGSYLCTNPIVINKQILISTDSVKPKFGAIFSRYCMHNIRLVEVVTTGNGIRPG
jgi:hypothetical protein